MPRGARRLRLLLDHRGVLIKGDVAGGGRLRLIKGVVDQLLRLGRRDVQLVLLNRRLRSPAVARGTAGAEEEPPRSVPAAALRTGQPGGKARRSRLRTRPSPSSRACSIRPSSCLSIFWSPLKSYILKENFAFSACLARVVKVESPATNSWKLMF